MPACPSPPRTSCSRCGGKGLAAGFCAQQSFGAWQRGSEKLAGPALRCITWAAALASPAGHLAHVHVPIWPNHALRLPHVLACHPPPARPPFWPAAAAAPCLPRVQMLSVLERKERVVEAEINILEYQEANSE